MLEARSTGYLDEITAALDRLEKQDPDNLYTITLRGAVYAGTLEKAGNMLARMTFGIRPAMVDSAFEKALKLNQSRYASPMLEYAIALERIDSKGRQQDIIRLLTEAVTTPADSAEAALHQRVAQQKLHHYQKP